MKSFEIMKPLKIFHDEIGIPNHVGLFMTSITDSETVLFQASEV